MGVISTILWPIIELFYLILVTVPGVAMYLLLTILDLLSNVAFDQLISGGEGAKIFGTVLGIGFLFFIVGYVFGIFKALFIQSKDRRDENVLNARSWRPQIAALTKSAIISLVVVFLLPLILILTSTILRSLQKLLAAWIMNEDWDNALFVATIMTLGYVDPNPEAGQISEVTLFFAQKLREGGLPVPGLGFGQGEPWDWNVALTLLSTLPIALSFASIVVGTISKIFEIFFLFILAPVILFIKNYDPKTRNDFMQKVLAKMLVISGTLFAMNIGFVIYNILTIPQVLELFENGIAPSMRWILRSVYKFFVIIATMEMVKSLPNLILDFFVKESIADGNQFKASMAAMMGPMRFVQMPVNAVMKARRTRATQRAQVLQNPAQYAQNGSWFERRMANKMMNQSPPVANRYQQAPTTIDPNQTPNAGSPPPPTPDSDPADE